MRQPTYTMTNLKPQDFAKISEFINNEYNEITASMPLFAKTKDGKLRIDDYTLEHIDDMWVVSHKGVQTQFNYKKTATYYIIANLLNMRRDILDIISADNKLAKAQSEITILKERLAEASKSQDAWEIGLYHNKLSEQVARFKQAKEQINRWVTKLAVKNKYYV